MDEDESEDEDRFNQKEHATKLYGNIAAQLAACRHDLVQLFRPIKIIIWPGWTLI